MRNVAVHCPTFAFVMAPIVPLLLVPANRGPGIAWQFAAGTQSSNKLGQSHEPMDPWFGASQANSIAIATLRQRPFPQRIRQLQ
jgi:hypothetical protein